MRLKGFLRTALMTKVMVAVSFCVLCGCGGDSSAPAQQPAGDDPKSRMQDAEYMEKLSGRQQEMKNAVSVRNGVARKMKEMAAAMKEKLGTDDMAKVTAELEKSEEWRKLSAEFAAAKENFEATRQKAMADVRERMNTGKKISK